jgi:hypothetical protein
MVNHLLLNNYLIKNNKISNNKLYKKISILSLNKYHMHNLYKIKIKVKKKIKKKLVPKYSSKILIILF